MFRKNFFVKNTYLQKSRKDRLIKPNKANFIWNKNRLSLK
jgi:hypothetical protein